MPLTLFNSLTRRLEPLTPVDPLHVSFYTCGPTVYDDAHIGNFRSFLAADVLRRFIESPLCELSTSATSMHRGPRRVTHVMNITDVGHMTDDAEGGEAGEDRMAVAGRRLDEAKKSGKLPAGTTIDPTDPYQIARFYEDRFREDAKMLGLKLAIDADRDPSVMPRATENVAGMIVVVKRLIDRGFAYTAGAVGSRVVYFDVQKFGPYGRLSGNTLDKLKAGEGGRVSAANQATKRHPADFLLWKEDPSHIMKWESPWGWGYPGWHIECTVMSVGRLIDGVTGPASLETLAIANGKPIIDVHSGGEDNIFPHHECEVAQSCCAFNETPNGGSFASMWFHPRFLLVEGTKMSKSKGNFYTARDLFAKGVEPAALRLELIKTHYRSNANFTMQGLQDSHRTVERWRRITSVAPDPNATFTPSQQATLDAFATAMHDDMNIALAIAAVNTWVSSVVSPTPADARVLQIIDQVVGVLALDRPAAQETSIAAYAPGTQPDAAVEALLVQRKAARAAKDFAASDAIRDQITALGYAIKDSAGGRVEVRRILTGG